jgi:hypothetical protein
VLLGRTSTDGELSGLSMDRQSQRQGAHLSLARAMPRLRHFLDSDGLLAGALFPLPREAHNNHPQNCAAVARRSWTDEHARSYTVETVVSFSEDVLP